MSELHKTNFFFFIFEDMGSCVLKASVSVSINIFDWPLTNTWLISWSPLDQHLYWRSVDQLICIDQYSMRCLWKISRLSTNVRLRCWSSVIRVSTDVFIKYWSSVDQGSVRVNRGCRSKVSINTRRCMHLVYMIWSLLLKNLSFDQLYLQFMIITLKTVKISRMTQSSD